MDDDSSTDDGCPQGGDRKMPAKKKSRKHQQATQTNSSTSATFSTSVMTYDNDSDDYDSDSSDYSENDSKKKSRVPPPMLLPTWEATKPSADGTILVRVKTLRGEYLTFSVHPSRHTIAHLRDAYWSTHPQWKETPPHKSINFICEETDFFLPENKPLAELGISKHGSVLLLVIGDDLRHTGGFKFPLDGKGSPIPPKNIYRVPVTNHNAAVPSNDPTPQDTKRAKVPGWMDIHAVVNTPGGTATVDGNTITHKASDGVHYVAGAHIPPEFLKRLDQTESELLQNLGGQGSVNRSDLGSRLREIKIGESEDLAHAMYKTRNMRTHYPHTLLHGYYIVHGKDHKEVEKALHTRYSLKRGGSSGEHFANLTQLNQHQILSLGELFPGATFVFFSTNSFPKCPLGEHINDKPGFVYKISPNWKDFDKKIFTNSISDFGEEDAFWPFDYHKDRVNFGTFIGIYLNYFKIGRYRWNNFDEYFVSSFLWACGFTGPEGAVYTFVHTETYKELEKKIHAELISLGRHINGEYFLPPPTDSTVSQELAQLLNTTPSILNRNPLNLRTTHSILHSWVKDHYLSHEIIWECMKEGAIVLCADYERGKGKWRDATTGEKAIGRIPALDSPICKELGKFLKLQGFSGNFDNITEDDFDKLLMAKDIRNAKDTRFVLIKVVTSDFNPPAIEDAKRDFSIIFGPSVYNQVSGIE